MSLHLRLLDQIVDDIKRGVQLLRAHLVHVEKKIETTVEVGKAVVEDIIFGPMTDEEVRTYLKMRAATAPDATDWEHSVVDLMKILGFDSSLAARRELAFNLGFTGAIDGSAAMNIALHDELMREIRHRVVIGPAA
jgi:hypothetical protein